MLENNVICHAALFRLGSQKLTTGVTGPSEDVIEHSKDLGPRRRRAIPLKVLVNDDRD